MKSEGEDRRRLLAEIKRMIDRTGKGIQCPNFEHFSSKCKEAIEKFRMEFPKELISDLKRLQSRTTPLFCSNNDVYSNIGLFYWENACLDLCRGFLMGCGVSRAESYDAAYFALKNNFWIKK